MLPIATKDGVVTPFFDALFTSTSAVCVTGLVVRDTGTYWSLFGQTVILILIQIGGMGVITVAATFAMISGRRITLMQRNTMQEALSAPKVGGIVRLTGFIVRVTLTIELIGALLLAPIFVRDFGEMGIFYALFHSISAFCNAGFDLMGVIEPFSSLTSYQTNIWLNLVIITLIIVGGIGFLTWEDINTNRFRIKRYRMQSKVILITTGVLLLVPGLYFFFHEYQDCEFSERLIFSFFQAVTPRTAGFNTTDLTTMSEAGITLMIFLMLIGGSPGSTAGGMKTTTLAVLVANALSVFQRKDNPECFGRRIGDDIIKNASTILTMYLLLFTFGGIIISTIEGLPVLPCLFETASAVGTVGLSLGLTTSLSLPSRLILILLMFFGRVGGLTLIFAALSGKKKVIAKLPLEKITVG